MIKNAIILAAGKGQRLDRPDTAKPLVQVAHKPLIIHSLERLREAGIRKAMVVLGNRADEIRKALQAWENGDLELEYVVCDAWQDGIIVSLRSALAQLKPDDFTDGLLVSMADLIFEDNPFFMLLKDGASRIAVLTGNDAEALRISGAQNAVAVKDGKVIGLKRGELTWEMRDIGVYRFSSEALTDLVSGENPQPFSFEDFINAYAASGAVEAVAYPGMWFDVNLPETCLRAELFLRNHVDTGSMAGVAHNDPLPETCGFTHKREVYTKVIVKRGAISALSAYDVLPAENKESPHYLLTDTIVDGLFGDKVIGALRESGLNIKKIVMEPGESSKTFGNYQRLAEDILGQGIDEKSVLFSLGGGAVGNVTGFLAATLYRGIGLVHIPTTLMAQSDAAVGIKQGVNGEKGKNLVGSYYEPLSVIIDPDFLAAMPERSIRDGLGECLKHALAQDAGYYDFFMQYSGRIDDLDFLEEVIRRNVKLKIELMEKDFVEEKEAIVLQYGHEVGHAVEYLSGYRLYHGESVAIGMRASAELAKLMGICDQETVEKHKTLLRHYGLEYRIPEDISDGAILEALRFSKKARHGLRFALVDKIGSLWSSDGEFALPCDSAVVERALKNSRD